MGLHVAGGTHMWSERRQKQKTKERNDSLRIKVFVVTWVFLPTIGAGANRVVDLIKYISKERFQISILTRKIQRKPQPWDKARSISLTGVRVYRAPSYFRYAWLNLPTVCSFFLYAFMIILKENPNVVFFTVPEAENALGAWLAAKLLRKPCVVDVRDLWEEARVRFLSSQLVDTRISSLKRILVPFLSLFNKGFDFVYKRSEVVIGVTPTILQSLMKRGIPKDKVYFVPNGAETAIFKPILDKKSTRKDCGLPIDDFILASEGIMAEEDPIDLVIKALKSLMECSSKRILFLIIGDFVRSTHKKRIEEMINALGLRKKVVITGIMPRERAAKLLAASDIGVLPLDDDPLWKYRVPLAFFDCLACSIPVAAFCYDDSDLAKIIQAYNCGLVVAPNNVPDLVEKLQMLMNEQALIDKLGKNGYHITQNLFNREKIARKFEEIFIDLSK